MKKLSSPAPQTQYCTFTTAQRNAQQGSVGEGATCVGPRVDLPLHCYLLFRHKGASWRCVRKKSQPENESTLSSTEKKTLVYPPWPLCHPWILFTPREVFSLMDPPCSLFIAPHPRHIHAVPPCCLCPASSFSLTLSFFYSPNQGRCSPSIANWLGLWTFITRQQEVCTVEMWESGSVLSGGMWAHPRDRRYITHGISVT